MRTESCVRVRARVCCVVLCWVWGDGVGCVCVGGSFPAHHALDYPLFLVLESGYSCSDVRTQRGSELVYKNAPMS